MNLCCDNFNSQKIHWQRDKSFLATFSSPLYTNADGGQTVWTPGEYVVIQANGKYGFGHIEYLPELPAASEMDSWAYPEVVAAIEENLVPVYLQNLYLNNITRQEFCDLVIQAIEEVLDKEIEDLVKERAGR